MRSVARRRAVLGLLPLACVLLLGACGNAPQTQGTAAKQAGKALVAAPPTSPPDRFPITEPLKRKPAAKQLTWLACELPTCQGALTTGFKAASHALGWKLSTVTYKTLAAAQGVQQALNAKPDYLAITGIPPAAFKAQAKQAVKQDIPIASCYDPTPPDAKTNGLVMQCANGNVIAHEGEQIANWMINDSGGKANVVMVTVGDYPILEAERKGITRAFKRGCPDCRFDVLPVTVDDVGGGEVPTKLVGYLQAHPNVNYVEFAFADLLHGAPAAIQAAGMKDKVKLTGLVFDATIAKEFVKGNVAAWTAQPNMYSSWLMTDALARLSVGQPLAPVEQKGEIPTWVVDSPQAAQKLLDQSDGEWYGPAGFQKKFQRLWGVG